MKGDERILGGGDYVEIERKIPGQKGIGLFEGEFD